MEKFFGIPMTTLSGALVAILLAVSAVIVVMALRNRIMLKLAVRNIPRRRAQTVLIVIGLMLSTAIITASLSIGDTVTGSIRGVVLDALGHTDLRVQSAQATGIRTNRPFLEGEDDGAAFFTDRYFGPEKLRLVLDAVAGDARVDGVLPQIRETLPVLNGRTELTEARMTVVGLDASREEGFGRIRTTAGDEIHVGDLAAREALLNESAAAELEAAAGDPLVIVTPTGRHDFTVRAVVREGGLAANDNRALVSLTTMQAVMGHPAQVNRIDISTTGGIDDGTRISGHVSDDLRVRFTDPLVAQTLFDVLRAPGAVRALTTYMDGGGNGALTAGAGKDLRELIDELTPGETRTALNASAAGLLLGALADPDIAGQLVAALGEDAIGAAFVAAGLPPDTGAGGLSAETLGQAAGLAADADAMASLLDALRGADIPAKLRRYLDANGAALPVQTTRSLGALADSITSTGGRVDEAPYVAVSDRFRSLAADSTLSLHVLVALEMAGRSDLVAPVTALFSRLELLSVDEIKADSLDLAEFVGNLFVTFFTIFGSFSIMVGLLLIFLVFVMLAAARSTEMGIARAVGTKRRHLVQMFTYEGFVYAIGAGLIGTLVGLLAGLILVQLIAGIINSDNDAAFSIRYSVTGASVAAAFSAGMILTLLTVAFSAYRVSKLNIVVAIRGLPAEFVPSDTPRLRRRLLALGLALLGPLYQLYRAVTAHRRREGAVLPVVMLFLFLLVLPWIIHFIIVLFRVFQPYLAFGWPVVILAVLLAAWGIRIGQTAPFATGVSLALVGLGLLIRTMLRHTELRSDVTDRVAFTFIGGTVLAFWALPFDALEPLTGKLDGNVEMFILSGVWMVAAAVWLVMYNSDLITRGLQATVGRFTLMRPILKPAIAYPMSARFRTGLTVAMFALVIFTMMVFAILNGIGSDLDQTPDRVTGGFDIRAETSLELPITDFRAALSGAPNLDSSDFEVIAPHTDVPAEARQSGAEEQRFLSLGVRGADPVYLRETRLEITHFDPSYLPPDTPLDDPVAVSRAVWDALADDPSLAVVSADLLESNSGGFRLRTAEFSIEGIADDDDGPIKAVQVQLRQVGGRGTATNRTVIGAMDSFAERFEFDGSIVANLVTRADVFQDLSGEPLPFTTFRIRLRDGADPGRIAAALETAFLDNSLEATDTLKEIRLGISQNNAFNRLFQGFMGLGLVVGVAALGVLSFRAVVERRHAIGMMRAIGYKGRMIQVQFLLESLFVTALGSALGLGLGALISWNIINDLSGSIDGISFTIPWVTVSAIVLIALVAAMATTFIPARQASRIYPSEALRYE